MRASLLATGILVAGCSSAADRATRLELTIAGVGALELDQLRIEGQRDSEDAWTPALLPEEARPLPEERYRVEVLLGDALSGETLTLLVFGLREAAVAGFARGTVEIAAGETVSVELALDRLRCGDALVTAGEACDDGNEALADGCAGDCATEAGYTCTAGVDGRSVCTLIAITACANGEDDDGDGLADYAASGGDPGCADAADDDERGADVCDDGIDNDGDGELDHLAAGGGDPGCAGPTDPSEKCFAEPCPACDNGLDDDGDARFDRHVDPRFGDPGCAAADDDSEKCTPGPDCSQCDDGVDNGDLDSAADGDDTSCASPAASEDNLLGCGDGADNDGDGLADGDDPGCDDVISDAREQGTSVCDDGLDNDGDGLADAADPGCASATDSTEQSAAACDDGVDNDGDELVDFRLDGTSLDPGCTSPQDDDEG